jgi:hypothetical protein
MQSNISRYTLAICAIHNDHIHGKDIESDPYIESNYLIINTVDNYSFERKYYVNDIDLYNMKYSISNNLDVSLSENTNQYEVGRVPRHRFEWMVVNRNIRNRDVYRHPIIRNYIEIGLKRGFVRLEVVEEIQLYSGEHIAILKTFWLRIFARIVKKRILIKKQIPIFLKNTRFLMNVEHMGSTYMKKEMKRVGIPAIPNLL